MLGTPRRCASTRKPPRSSTVPARIRHRGPLHPVAGAGRGNTSDYDKEKLQERLAKLAGGIAIIRVGGNTEIEVKERKDRVDDAMHATRAAVEEGVVPAAASPCSMRSSRWRGSTREQRPKVGIDIVRRALQAPARQIFANAGKTAPLSWANCWTRATPATVSTPRAALRQHGQGRHHRPTKVVRLACRAPPRLPDCCHHRSNGRRPASTGRSGDAGRDGRHGRNGRHGLLTPRLSSRRGTALPQRGGCDS